MPIRKEMQQRYPKDWALRSRFVRLYRARNRCEWCGVHNYSPRLGTIALVQERVNSSLGRLASRRDEVKQRCRTVLQSKVDELLRNSQPNSPRSVIAHATCNLTNQCRSGRLRFAL